MGEERSARAPAQTRRAVGLRVRQAGEALKLRTRGARAKQCGLPVETLRDIEIGRKGPGMGVLQKICQGYGADANWLLGVSR